MPILDQDMIDMWATKVLVESPYYKIENRKKTGKIRKFLRFIWPFGK